MLILSYIIKKERAHASEPRVKLRSQQLELGVERLQRASFLTPVPCFYLMP